MSDGGETIGMRIVQFFAAAAVTALAGYSQGIITTVAGSSKCCNSADGGQAVDTWLPSATGITVDRQGNLYIWEGGSSKVRKVSPNGIITTVAGTGPPATPATADRQPAPDCSPLVRLPGWQ